MYEPCLFQISGRGPSGALRRGFLRRSILYFAVVCICASLAQPQNSTQGNSPPAQDQHSARRGRHLKTYTITDLGSLEAGYGGSSATAINNKGQIIGISFSAFNGGQQAFLWEGGQMIALGDENNHLNVRAINDRGQIVGDYGVPGRPGIQHAFLWQDGQILDLGTLGGPADYSYAQGINNKGEIVGASDPPDTNAVLRAFLWRNNQMTDIGALAGPDNRDSYATAINNRGEIVGASDTGYSATRGTRFCGGTVTSPISAH